MDYEMVPAPDTTEFWAIRINEGDFVETVFKFGVIKIEEEEDENGDNVLTFDVEIISTPDPDLTVDNKEFQEYTGKILLDVIKEQISYNENRTDNSS